MNLLSYSQLVSTHACNCTIWGSFPPPPLPRHTTAQYRIDMAAKVSMMNTPVNLWHLNIDKVTAL